MHSAVSEHVPVWEICEITLFDCLKQGACIRHNKMTGAHSKKRLKRTGVYWNFHMRGVTLEDNACGSLKYNYSVNTRKDTETRLT